VASVVVIERDEPLALGIASALEQAGHTVEILSEPDETMKHLYQYHPDLVIISEEFSKIDGEILCSRIRKASYLPIIYLGSNNRIIEALESGFDAYIGRPPDLRELVARVQSLIRRKPRVVPPKNNPGVSINRYLLREGNGLATLTPTESRLASYLVSNKERLIGYRDIIGDVWGGKMVSVNTLHFHIRKLLSKLVNGSIVRIRGQGYFFRPLTGGSNRGN